MENLTQEQYNAIHEYMKNVETAVAKIAENTCSRDCHAIINHVLTILDIHRELARIDMEWTRGKKTLDKIKC